MVVVDPTIQNIVDSGLLHNFASDLHFPNVLHLRRIHIENLNWMVIDKTVDSRYVAMENEPNSNQTVAFGSDFDLPFLKQSNDHRHLLFE